MKSAGCVLFSFSASFLLLAESAVVFAARADVQTCPSRLPPTNLLVYRDKRGEVRPAKSKSDWQKRRAEILRGMQAIMGPLPGKAKRCPLDVRVETEEDCGSYARRLISYASEPGSRVPAYLLIPKRALTGKARLPAVLALHPTDLNYGHRVTVEQMGAKNRVYAHDLAERGFVVLAPAYPIMADYQPDLNSLGYASGTMKAIWDNLRGLDLLDSLPCVKRGHYAAVGHSLGGHNAIFTAVFDERIKAVVSSSGFDSFLAYYGGDPKNWQPERGWCQTRYMPKLAEYRGRLADIPFDFHELLGALAPRAVFINAPLQDANFQWRSVDEIVKAAAPVFDLYGARQNLRIEHPDCAHDFPEAVRQQAYAFLVAALNH